MKGIPTVISSYGISGRRKCFALQIALPCVLLGGHTLDSPITGLLGSWCPIYKDSCFATRNVCLMITDNKTRSHPSYLLYR
jgi:hypothetical protein